MGVSQLSTDTPIFVVELISEKMITPSSPTPKNLRQYKLSSLDQLTKSQYIPVTLFYPNISTPAFSSSSSSPSPPSVSVCSTLETSLAKMLSYYYPCAGKLVDNSHVDCNDAGVLFKEVRVKASMLETITNNKLATVQKTLFPGHALPWGDTIEGGSLAVAQLTHFDCGGLALSLCLTHKLGDGFTICKFYNDWAELARNSTFLANPPSLIGSSLLRPKDDPCIPDLYIVTMKPHVSTVRLRFNPTNIKRLQAIVSSESDVKDPTRFEVVAALVNKCAAMADDSNNPSSRSFDPFTIYIPMNIRNVVTPPVPNYFGNFFSFVLIEISGEDDLKLPNLVTKIRKEKVKHIEKFKGKNKDGILGEISKEEKLYRGVPIGSSSRLTSSLCRYNLYDIDFGWGKPARATIGTILSDNYLFLTDTPEKGGIDVFGAFEPNVAFKFKNDKDMLQFASVDLSY